MLRSCLALRGWIHGSNNEDLSKRLCTFLQNRTLPRADTCRPKRSKTKGGTLGWKKYFVHPRFWILDRCGRHISVRGRVLICKKVHSLLDKSSLFDPWIHPLSAKKDLSTLKFNTLCYHSLNPSSAGDKEAINYQGDLWRMGKYSEFYCFHILMAPQKQTW